MLIKKIPIFQLLLFSFLKEDSQEAKKFLKEKKIPTTLKKKLLRA